MRKHWAVYNEVTLEHYTFVSQEKAVEFVRGMCDNFKGQYFTIYEAVDCYARVIAPVAQIPMEPPSEVLREGGGP